MGRLIRTAWPPIPCKNPALNTQVLGLFLLSAKRVSVYRIPLYWVTWSPPVQTAAKQSAIGREVEARGARGHVGRFIAEREPFFAGIRFGWIALAVAILTLICIVVPPLLPVFLGVLIINLVLYWGSFFFAVLRYTFWLRRCRRAYAKDKSRPLEAECEVIPSHVVISCPSCVQKLRVPTDRSKMRVKCPSCAREFVFDRAEYKW
jgi:hypothetical protein